MTLYLFFFATALCRHGTKLSEKNRHEMWEMWITGTENSQDVAYWQDKR